MTLGLSNAYKVVKILDENRASSVLDKSSLDEDVSDADQELEKSLRLFQKYADEALRSPNKNIDDESFLEKIMFLRIHAISISTLMDNFIDTIDKVLKD